MKGNLSDEERSALQHELNVLAQANAEREAALARRGVTARPEVVGQLQLQALMALVLDGDDKVLQFNVEYQRQASQMLAAIEEQSARPRLHVPGNGK